MGRAERQRARHEAARWMAGSNGQIHLVPRASSSGPDQEAMPSQGGGILKGVAIFLAGVACGAAAMAFIPSELPWSSAPQAPAAVSPTPAVQVPASIEVTADPSESAPTAPGGAAPDAPSVYTVQPGDSLSAIASRLGISVEALAAANEITDHGRILVGQELRVPSVQD